MMAPRFHCGFAMFARTAAHRRLRSASEKTGVGTVKAARATCGCASLSAAVTACSGAVAAAEAAANGRPTPAAAARCNIRRREKPASPPCFIRVMWSPVLRGRHARRRRPAESRAYTTPSGLVSPLKTSAAAAIINRPIALLYLLFLLSGLSGLIYQVIWVRVFGNVFGNTIYSASLVVAVFMLGLGVGSYIVGAWSDRRYAARPESLLRAYGCFELLIGALGLGISALLPHLVQVSALVSSYAREASG